MVEIKTGNYYISLSWVISRTAKGSQASWWAWGFGSWDFTLEIHFNYIQAYYRTPTNKGICFGFLNGTMWKLTNLLTLLLLRPGPWFNIKMSSYRYRKSHCGDKTVIRPSYLHNGISYTGKMSSLYWIRALSIWENQVNITAANALAPCIMRSSVATIQTM